MFPTWAAVSKMVKIYVSELLSPNEVWQNNPSLLASEILYYLWTLLTLLHAFRHGGRCLLLWIGVFVTGSIIECLNTMPMSDSPNTEKDLNITYTKTMHMVVLVNQYLPLHVLCFYPCFYYTTILAVDQLKLPWWAEPCAVGLGNLLLIIPLQIIGVKFQWWKWSTSGSEPITYCVPWAVYCFQLISASSFTFFLGGTRWLLTPGRGKMEMVGNRMIEVFCIFLTGVLTIGCFFFYSYFYHYGDVDINTFCYAIVGLFVILAWSGDRGSGIEAQNAAQNAGEPLRHNSYCDSLFLGIVSHYLFFIVLVCLIIYGFSGSLSTSVWFKNLYQVLESICTNFITKYLPEELSGYIQHLPEMFIFSDSQQPINDSNNGCASSECIHMVILSCLFGFSFFYQWFFGSIKHQG